jgi:hypothetical protein
LARGNEGDIAVADGIISQAAIAGEGEVIGRRAIPGGELHAAIRHVMAAGIKQVLQDQDYIGGIFLFQDHIGDHRLALHVDAGRAAADHVDMIHP